MDRSIHLDIRASEIDNMEGDGAFVFWQGTSAENMYDLMPHRTSIVLSMEGFCGRRATCRRTGSVGIGKLTEGVGRRETEGERDGGRERRRERETEGERDGGRQGWREPGREGARDRWELES
jgi:hypothetical protein